MAPSDDQSPDQGPNDWKTKFTQFTRTGILARLRGGASDTRSFSRLPALDPMAMLERLSNHFQQHGFGFYGWLLTTVVCAWLMANVSSLLLENMTGTLLERLAPPPSGYRGSRFGEGQRRTQTLEDLNVIYARNLVNSKGLIPGEDQPQDAGAPDLGGEPQKTTLPFNLIGTLIMRDELRSIATIEDKSASAVYPVRVQDEIPAKAKILRIEPRKVIFVNTSTGRREYVDLPEDLATTNARITLGRPAGGGGGIEKLSGNQFSVARTEVDKAFSNLNEVLTQARAVPYMENGVPAGYQLFQVVPGGFFSNLGLKDRDIICGVDGQPVNDPAKAVELLGQLETASHLELCIKRDGKQQNFAYDIR